MKNKRKPVILTVSILGGLLAIACCIWFFWGKNALKAANSDPVYVNSVAAIAGLDTGSNPRYSGVVEPQTIYKVEKDETKTVSEVLVAEGEPVQVGTPLFRYDTEDMRLSLSEAQLDLERTTNLISTLKTQKSTLEAEQKKASKDDQYSYTVEIQSVELQIKTEEYNSSVKKGEIEKLQQSLNNAEVLSEAEGVIQEINTTPKTDSSGQPAPFISILSSGEYKIKGTVSELNYRNLFEGQAVVVYSRADSAVSWAGTVETIGTEPTQQNNNNYYYGMDSGDKSSKYDFYVSLQNPEGLILGQHVYIEPDLGEPGKKEGIWLPAFYVAHDNAGSYVWARNDKDKLEKRTVTLGEYDTENDLYEIKSGLNQRDAIAYPEESLMEGMPTTQDNSGQTAIPGQDTGGAGAIPGEEDGILIPPEEGVLPADGDFSEDGGLHDDGSFDNDTFPEDNGDTASIQGNIILGGSDASAEVFTQ